MGKTALVDLIANAYTDRTATDDHNSFVKRIAEDCPALKLRLTFKNDEAFEKTIDEDAFFDESGIVYVAQGELERYVSDPSELTVYINDLIFGSAHIKNSATVFEYVSFTESGRKAERQLGALNADIDRLGHYIETHNAASITKDGRRLAAELKDVDARITKYVESITPERRAVASERQSAVTKLERRKNGLLALKNVVVETAQLIDEYVQAVTPQITRIGELAKELGMEHVSLDQPAYAGSNALLGIGSQVDTALREVVGKVEVAQNQLRGLEADMQGHASALARQAELQGRIEALRGENRSVQAEGTRLREKRAERDKEFGTLVRNVLAEREKYDEVITLFESEKNDVLAELEFVAEVVFDRARLLADLEVVVDNRQVEVFGDDRTPSAFDRLTELYGLVAEGDDGRIGDLVAETARLTDELKPKLKRAGGITEANLYKCIYGRYLAIRPSVKYRRTALNRLSLGQKATVLIKIYLAEGTNPIIIDSHDDHLDNEFIMDELVAAIRQAKQFRQIILASNNGNVVINSDAEQVILAQCVDGEISYGGGSLENRAVRVRALKILEGGADAFRKRQEKYRISRVGRSS